MDFASRVAARYLRASYFSLGDRIYYGKYKNKVGIVTAFGEDQWGNPTVEVEPVPKGRKKNKVMGLFRIWRADVKDNALKERQKEVMKSKTAANVAHKFQTATRVAERYDTPSRVAGKYIEKQAAAVLQVGHTWENEKIRVHMYSQSVAVWDLTNAGKRGKKVERFDLSSVESGDGRLHLVAEAAQDHGYKGALKEAEKQKDLSEEGVWAKKLHLYKQDLRGVDVAPAGFKPLSIDTDGVHIQSDYKGFTIKNKKDRANEPTCIDQGKESVKQFYRWITDNQSKVLKMTFQEIIRELDEQGIKHHYYCAMD